MDLVQFGKKLQGNGPVIAREVQFFGKIALQNMWLLINNTTSC